MYRGEERISQVRECEGIFSQYLIYQVSEREGKEVKREKERETGGRGFKKVIDIRTVNDVLHYSYHYKPQVQGGNHENERTNKRTSERKKERKSKVRNPSYLKKRYVSNKIKVHTRICGNNHRIICLSITICVVFRKKKKKVDQRYHQ